MRAFVRWFEPAMEVGTILDREYNRVGGAEVINPFSHKILVFKNLVRCRHFSHTHQSTRWRGGSARLELDRLSMMAAYLKLTKLTH